MRQKLFFWKNSTEIKGQKYNKAILRNSFISDKRGQKMSKIRVANYIASGVPFGAPEGRQFLFFVLKSKRANSDVNFNI